MGKVHTGAGVLAPTVAVSPLGPSSRPAKVWICSATMRPLRTLTLVATRSDSVTPSLTFFTTTLPPGTTRPW